MLLGFTRAGLAALRTLLTGSLIVVLLFAAGNMTCMPHPADCPADAVRLRKECSGGSGLSPLLLWLLWWSIAGPRGPQFAYITSTGLGGNDIVSAYRINETTGHLEHSGDTVVQADPYDLTVDQTGRYLYVMNSASNTISQFRIDGSSGGLTEIAAPLPSVSTPFAGPTLLNGTQLYIPSGAAANALGRYAIGMNGSLSFQETIAGPGAGNMIWFMRGTPDSRFLYATIYNATTIAQYSVSSSGSLTALGTAATQTNPWSVEVEPHGRFAYVANYGSASVSQFTINSGTGQLSAMTPAFVASGAQPVGIVSHPTSSFLYVANSGAGTVSQYRMDGSSGTLSALTPASVGAPGAYGLAMDRSGRFLYVCDSNAARAYQFLVATDGTLSPQSSPTVATGSACRFIALVGT